MKKSLTVLSAIAILALGGCGSSSARVDSNTNITTTSQTETQVAQAQPHVTKAVLSKPKMTRAVVADFENDSTVTREVNSIYNNLTAQLSVTQMANQNLALMVNIDNPNVQHVEFYIDLDHDSSTGLQLNSRNSWRDTTPQPDGNIGADLIIVDGVMHYFNRATRSWRWWYLSWQRLMRVDFNPNPDAGRFIVEIPSSFLTLHAPADRERFHAYEHYGFVDYDDVAARFNGDIRVGVALFREDENHDWLYVMDSLDPVEFHYTPNLDIIQNSLTAEVANNELHINIALLENEAGSRTQLFLRDTNDQNRFGGYLIEGRNLYRYAGNGTNWRWEFVTQVVRNADANSISLVVPVRALEFNGNVRIDGSLLTQDWRRLRDLEPTTVRIDNNGDNGGGDLTFWNGTNTGPSINITANLANITPNDRTQFFIRDRANQDRYSGFLVEGSILYRYAGNGNNWRWERIGEVDYQREGDTVTVSIPTDMADFPQDGIAFLRTWSRDWTQTSFFGPDDL